jgi:hypothetical protein
VATVVLGLRLKAGMQLPVLLGFAVAAIGRADTGHPVAPDPGSCSSGVTDGMPAVSILLLVGAHDRAVDRGRRDPHDDLVRTPVAYSVDLSVGGLHS